MANGCAELGSLLGYLPLGDLAEVNANCDVPDVMYGNRKAIASFLRQFGCQRVKTKTFKQELSYSWCKAEAHQ